MSKEIKYRCDHCSRETKNVEKGFETDEMFPEGWLTIKAEHIENKIVERKLIRAGKNEYHFCSKSCFIGAFFYVPNECKTTKE